MENDGYNIDSSDSPSVPHKLVQGSESLVNEDSQLQTEVQVIETHVGEDGQSQRTNTDVDGLPSVDHKDVSEPDPEAREKETNDTQSSVENGKPCEQRPLADGMPCEPSPVGNRKYEQRPTANGTRGYYKKSAADSNGYPFKHGHLDTNTDKLQTPCVLTVSGLLESKHALKGRDGDDEDTLIGTPRRNGSARFSIQRNVLDQKQFDESYSPGNRPSPTLKERIKKKVTKCAVSGPCLKNFLLTLFPCIGIMKSYNFRTDIMGDIVSGLTVGIMNIPQGMAYGMLTTLPPVYGLYMSFFPVLTYFLFGSSRHISIGTFAVACLMTGSAVNKGFLKTRDSLVLSSPTGNLTLNDTVSPPEEGSGMSEAELNIRLQYAMSMSFMVGIVQLIMGVFRLGFVTVYLSDPLISGFTTGAACHVFTSQIKHVFGIKTERYSGAFKLIYTYRDFFKNIGQTNLITLAISVVCMVILYCTSRFINQNPKLKPKMIMPVPIELIVVVLGTVISFALNLEETHNVIVVSDIPTGLPVPNTNCFTHIPEIISDAIALAIVIFAVSISMAKILAKKHDYEVNANQELIAFALSTIFSSFFSAASPSASLSRSLVQERVGGKTQLAGLFSCVLLLVVLLAVGPYFRTLPNCVLASIILIALRGMFLQILDLKKLWNVSKIDFIVWIVAFVATVVLDVDLGLGVAVIFAILTVVCRSQRPYSCVLGQMPDTDIYRDINVYQEAKEIPGLKIFRFENSLFFVNTEHFRTSLYKRTVNPRDISIARKKREAKVEKKKKKMETPDVSIPADATNMEMELKVTNNETKVALTQASDEKQMPQDVDFHTIILDCSSWSFIDSMAVKVLTAVISEYKSIGVKVCLANCKAGIREMFGKTNFYDTLENSLIFVSVHDAVLYAESKELENYENGFDARLTEEPTIDITVGDNEDSDAHKEQNDSPA